MTANKKVVHLIGWFKFCGIVRFGPLPDRGMEIQETHTWGYKTACGQVFWPTLEGTTNRKDVTCKRCKKVYTVSFEA